jgi:hypothetical protein
MPADEAPELAAVRKSCGGSRVLTRSRISPFFTGRKYRNNSVLLLLAGLQAIRALSHQIGQLSGELVNNSAKTPQHALPWFL